MNRPSCRRSFGLERGAKPIFRVSTAILRSRRRPLRRPATGQRMATNSCGVTTLSRQPAPPLVIVLTGRIDRERIKTAAFRPRAVRRRAMPPLQARTSKPAGMPTRPHETTMPCRRLCARQCSQSGEIFPLGRHTPRTRFNPTGHFGRIGTFLWKAVSDYSEFHRFVFNRRKLT